MKKHILLSLLPVFLAVAGAKADDFIRFENGKYGKYWSVLWADITFDDGRIRVMNISPFSVCPDGTEEELKEAGAVVLEKTALFVYISPVNIEKIFISHTFSANEEYDHDQIMKKCGL